MSGIVFIGDELTASGFRLAGAGIEVVTPKAGDISAAFERARQQADVVLVGADVARLLPDETLQAAIEMPHPVVAVIPDIRGHAAPPDTARRIKTALGIGTS